MVISELLNKWVKGILSHPFSIFKGNWFRITNQKKSLYNKRYEICRNCPEIENTPIGEVCGICGCPLKSKLRVKEEMCELDKWR